MFRILSKIDCLCYNDESRNFYEVLKCINLQNKARIKHKVNDKGLKRRLAISHRKVGKLFDGLLASFG